MNSINDFIGQMDWWGLVTLLVSAVAALLCITIHELCHGFAAWKLGDPTAKNAGRLTLNPIRHIDPVGLVMMLVAKVGWAKPVPVDMRYFKNPRRDMALTALAGPLSNFLTAVAALGICSLIYNFGEVTRVSLIVLCFFCNVAILSVGLGLFNLIPISPLDGSKVLYAFLPERVYYTILRYERYVMILVVVLTLAGVFQKPLSILITGALELLCSVTRLPLGALLRFQDVAWMLSML